jgi:hypothetical protein
VCLTGPVPARRSVVPSLDKGTPGKSRGRKATGPRLLRDAAFRRHEGPQDRRATEGCLGLFAHFVNLPKQPLPPGVLMHPARCVVPLTLAVFVLGCQDGNGPTPAESAPVAGQPLAGQIVDRFRHFEDGALLHFTPEVTFTVGLVDPLDLLNLPECGGTGGILESDLRGFDQIVFTPPGPERQVRRYTGTVVLYDVSLLELDSVCELVDHIVGIGQGTFTSTDNSLTGVGPGVNAWGFMANAILTLTDGSKAKFTAIVRFAGGAEPIVDNVTLRPIGN